MPPVSQTWKGSPVSDFYEEKDADQSTHEVEIEESEDEIDELDKDTVSDDLCKSKFTKQFQYQF